MSMMIEEIFLLINKQFEFFPSKKKKKKKLRVRREKIAKRKGLIRITLLLLGNVHAEASVYS